MIASRVKKLALVAAVVLLPSAAAAGPITIGSWSTVGDVLYDGGEFWDNRSRDCGRCDAAVVLKAWYGELEYLHDGTGKPVSFAFSQKQVHFTPVFSLSALKGTLSFNANGRFAYDNGAGFLSNSVQHPGQFALFRQVDADVIRYFLGVEDIPVHLSTSDRDYNDSVVSFTQVQVPEPSVILLLGSGLAGFGLRRLRRG